MAKKAPSLANVTLKKGSTPTAAVPSASANEDKSTEQRKGQTLRLSIGAWKQLKHLAADLGKPVHDLLIEAVNDLFSKYGKPPVA
ncbi:MULTISPECIES: ribbon-helix-helix domain-containing protein [unclassified Coleofasciculus]|uniref:ribbon-helix-helix domain-containing protein n=1 Tax=unclassified Coleofasciculus TaxID=2692782 RepID=UPI001882D880|nr:MULTISPECIES: ribbon-helix-helix domain-containing protein [unclassified Coleofasciculus]MBE9128713.1 hypothetical protein [Coleofasciculus sp. LEGE 07081]MBE9149872.1 hypothetical protein [Coleofasciculus sp. LEGE 07092]